jgi:proteasome lid subunit RPN8/RPN11
MERFIKNILKEGFEKLFDIDKKRFNKIFISKSLIDQCLEFAKDAYPKEFLAFIDGHIKDNALILDKLLYHQYESSEYSAAPIFQFNYTGFYGSVHSHPSYSNKPSNADIRFFNKLGIVHCIISKPFNIENAKFYDHNGDEIIVEIKEEKK